MKELTKWVNEVLEMVNRPKFTYQNMKKERMIIGLAGGLQSGKDTTAKILIDKYGFKKLAFADALRDSLYTLNPVVDYTRIDDKFGFTDFQEIRLQDLIARFGWEKAKVQYPEIRRLLQVLGTESGREVHGQNCWVDIVARQLDEDLEQNFVISDLRFPSELEMIHEYGGKSIRITRKGFEPKGNHASEMWLEGVQHSIPNDGTLEDLERHICMLYEAWVPYNYEIEPARTV